MHKGVSIEKALPEWTASDFYNILGIRKTKRFSGIIMEKLFPLVVQSKAVQEYKPWIKLIEQDI